jgi:hypothetical protein
MEKHLIYERWTAFIAKIPARIACQVKYPRSFSIGYAVLYRLQDEVNEIRQLTKTLFTCMKKRRPNIIRSAFLRMTA